jgi:hypothetical protein
MTQRTTCWKARTPAKLSDTAVPEREGRRGRQFPEHITGRSSAECHNGQGQGLLPVPRVSGSRPGLQDPGQGKDDGLQHEDQCDVGNHRIGGATARCGDKREHELGRQCGDQDACQ